MKVGSGGGRVFPQPFSGIQFALSTGSREKLIEVVTWLSGPCGHDHATAVFPGTNQVWVSKLGADCAERMPGL